MEQTEYRQISSVIAAVNDLAYAQYADQIRLVGKLQTALLPCDLDSWVQQLHDGQPKVAWLNVPSFRGIGSLANYFLRAEQGLFILKELKSAKDPARRAYEITLREMGWSSADDFLQGLFKEALEPTSQFLRQLIEEANEAANEQDVVGEINTLLITNDWLIVPTPFFRARGTDIDPLLIFLIGPFDDFLFKELKPCVERACAHETLEDRQFVIETAQQPTTGDVISEIWTFIRQAGIIIADIPQVIVEKKKLSNFNVAYEVGIAHALGKEVVILADLAIFPSRNDLPFDLGRKRAISYERDKLDKLADEIVPFIAASLSKDKWPKSQFY